MTGGTKSPSELGGCKENLIRDLPSPDLAGCVSLYCVHKVAIFVKLWLCKQGLFRPAISVFEKSGCIYFT